MEEKTINDTNEAETNEPNSRLSALAERSGQTVEELLDYLESKQAVKEENTAAQNKSTGSQSTNQSGFFDPAGNEFLKGIWSK